MARRIRTPVKRAGSEHYVFLTLMSFAAAVLLTRLFLALTGYPQVGGGEFHIAHVLWGGLFLFVATLLLLIFSNHWVYTGGAILSGVGVGLFIDEVGKFITQSNNYFFPLAGPIIYAFFLLTVLLYLRVRRPPPHNPRDELYHVFDDLGEVLDRDLDSQERAAIETRLRYIATQTERPDLAPLALSLLTFLSGETLVPPPSQFWERRLTQLEAWEDRLLGQRILKGVLIVGLCGLGLLAGVQLVSFFLAVVSPDFLQALAHRLVTAGEGPIPAGLNWVSLIALALVGLTGLLLLAAAGLLLLGRDRSGVAWGYLGLLLSLTVVNLVVFYFDQFTTVLTAFVQLILLVVVLRYRRRYLTDAPRPATQAGGSG